MKINSRPEHQRTTLRHCLPLPSKFSDCVDAFEGKVRVEDVKLIFHLDHSPSPLRSEIAC